jgi:hypothetical protein
VIADVVVKVVQHNEVGVGQVTPALLAKNGLDNHLPQETFMDGHLHVAVTRHQSDRAHWSLNLSDRLFFFLLVCFI